MLELIWNLYLSKERESKHMARGKAEFRNKERAKENVLKRKTRSDPLKETVSRKKLRLNPYVLEKEGIVQQVIRSNSRTKGKEKKN